jgi:serine/threonine-protein kinase
MSPEQALGDPAIDARTDVWSMGVVFHEALSGMLPYDAQSANALIAKIIYEEPTALTVHAPHLPRDLAAVIQRAVTRDRDVRWPTMQAFADALRACATWRGVDPATAARWVINAEGVSRAAPPPTEPIDELGRTMEAPPAVPSAPVAPAPTAHRSDVWNGEVEDPAPPRRRPWRAVVLAGGFVAALAITAGLTMATRPEPPVVPTVRAVAPPPRPVEAVPAVVATAAAAVAAPQVPETLALPDGGAQPPVRGVHREHRGGGARVATARGAVTTPPQVAPPTPPPIAAPTNTAPTRRGFNGARILE